MLLQFSELGCIKVNVQFAFNFKVLKTGMELVLLAYQLSTQGIHSGKTLGSPPPRVFPQPSKSKSKMGQSRLMVKGLYKISLSVTNGNWR